MTLLLTAYRFVEILERVAAHDATAIAAITSASDVTISTGHRYEHDGEHPTGQNSLLPLAAIVWRGR